MDRRTFLGALASGGAAALGGCTFQRERLHSVSATLEIPSGEYFHEPLQLDGPGKQFNLQYEVAADRSFDVLLFGGQSPPEEFGVYRRVVRGAGGWGGDDRGAPDDETGPEAGDRGNGGMAAGGCRFGTRSGPDHDHDDGRHADCPHASGWHSVVGAPGRAEVNRPLRPGTHHFVVDNTRLGEATPEGTLRPTVDLAVRDFEPFSG
ncbi:hypothetical protein [Haloglomus litoreum]|uniref:hypothetical protein n=1 Tax=Haloglomus litoreum TaxID=3034026 RepID=UPI0023E77845|nr:hypothetical protein [Haloglomus sp. DT116]